VWSSAGSRLAPQSASRPPPLRMATETFSNIVFTGPLAWTADAACAGETHLFFAPAGERPEARVSREAQARAICGGCAALDPCRRWARENREYGFWGGESEEERAAAGFRVDMPVGRVARYPKGNGRPVTPRPQRVA
jgi:WhiB family redox-sensing transcriptional regulator